MFLKTVTMAKECLFCGSKKNLSKEHIIPLWLIKDLSIDATQLYGTHSTIVGFPKSVRRQRPKTLVNTMVCQKCNNGWMASLETSSMPYIKPFIHFDISKIDAEFLRSFKQNHETLAKWSFKTTILLNYPSNYRKLVPKNHFADLYNSKIPNGVFVNWGITTNEDKVNWRQSQSIFLLCPKSEVETNIQKTRDSSYKITYQFKHLLIRTSFFPSKNYFQDVNGQHSLSIWPRMQRYEKFKLYKDIDEFDNEAFFTKAY